ncbi:hypothetical protein GALL_271460 [mine drainage metagenome]|jgi:hypothetical protein|uniref:Uncharacterized protein n=1 Tax=mine drainage metagenome TaxID=410659 RepID=A0A1J5RSB6_9ZZZZ
MNQTIVARTARAGAVVACLLCTLPAHADGWRDRDGGGAAGFIAGLVTGAVVAPFFAPRGAPVYVAPPVVYAPPPVTYVPAVPAYGWAPAPGYRWHREHDDRPRWRGDDDR